MRVTTGMGPGKDILQHLACYAASYEILHGNREMKYASGTHVKGRRNRSTSEWKLE